MAKTFVVTSQERDQEKGKGQALLRELSGGGVSPARGALGPKT